MNYKLNVYLFIQSFVHWLLLARSKRNYIMWRSFWAFISRDFEFLKFTIEHSVTAKQNSIFIYFELWNCAVKIYDVWKSQSEVIVCICAANDKMSFFFHSRKVSILIYDEYGYAWKTYNLLQISPATILASKEAKGALNVSGNTWHHRSTVKGQSRLWHFFLGKFTSWTDCGRRASFNNYISRWPISAEMMFVCIFF